MSQRSSRVDGLLQLLQPLAAAGLHQHYLGHFFAQFIQIDGTGQVGLVHHHYGRPAGYLFQQLPVLAGQWGRVVKQRQNKCRTVQLLHRSLHPDALHRVVGLAQSGGIGQP